MSSNLTRAIAMFQSFTKTLIHFVPKVGGAPFQQRRERDPPTHPRTFPYQVFPRFKWSPPRPWIQSHRGRGGGEGILDWALVAILNSRIGTNDNFNIFTYGSLHRASRFNIGAKALGNLVPRIPYYVCYSSRWASQLVLPKGCIQTLQLAGSVFCVPE